MLVMGKIFYIFGKSASGKDCIFRHIKEEESFNLQGITLYTTRPRRFNETDHKEYIFISEEELKAFQDAKKVIELRTYQTMHGPWSYGMMDDGQIDLANQDYLVVGVLESYVSTRDYFGTDKVVPLYIEVEDGERLTRALRREGKQEIPRYAEMCRRFLTDSEDFSEERLAAAGIVKRYRNHDLEQCLNEIRAEIRAHK